MKRPRAGGDPGGVGRARRHPAVPARAGALVEAGPRRPIRSRAGAAAAADSQLPLRARPLSRVAARRPAARTCGGCAKIPGRKEVEQSRLLAEAYEEHGVDPEAWRRLAETWDFGEINELIEKPTATSRSSRGCRWIPARATSSRSPAGLATGASPSTLRGFSRGSPHRLSRPWPTTTTTSTTTSTTRTSTPRSCARGESSCSPAAPTRSAQIRQCGRRPEARGQGG